MQGNIPLTWGGRTWWLPSNYATYVLWAWLGKPAVDKAVSVGGTWKQPAAYDAIKTAFVTWADKGYYPKDALSLTNEEAFMLFYQGITQLFPGGNAFLPGLIENVKNFDDLSQFLWPVPKKGQKSNTVTWCGSMYIINASTKHPKVAIDYLDFLMATEESARVWYEVSNRIPPYKKPIANLKVNPLVRETLDILTAGNADLTPAHNTLSPPEAATWMTDGIGKVFLKQVTPEQFVDELDRLWQKGRAEGMTRDTVSVK